MPGSLKRAGGAAATAAVADKRQKLRDIMSLLGRPAAGGGGAIVSGSADAQAARILAALGQGAALAPPPQPSTLLLMGGPAKDPLLAPPRAAAADPLSLPLLQRRPCDRRPVRAEAAASCLRPPPAASVVTGRPRRPPTCRLATPLIAPCQPRIDVRDGRMPAVRPPVQGPRRRPRPLLRAVREEGRQGGRPGAPRAVQRVRQAVPDAQSIRPVLLGRVPKEGARSQPQTLPVPRSVHFLPARAGAIQFAFRRPPASGRDGSVPHLRRGAPCRRGTGQAAVVLLAPLPRRGHARADARVHAALP